MPLWRRSSEVVNFLRPFFLREANTARPWAVPMRLRNPCLFLRFVFEGWYVLFIAISQTYLSLIQTSKEGGKDNEDC
jgi:hypothetical protein